MEYIVKMTIIHGIEVGGGKESTPAPSAVWNCAICKTGQLHNEAVVVGTQLHCSVCEQHFTVKSWTNRTESGDKRDVIVEAERPTKLELLRS